jgi:hypothetical protein
VNAQLRADEQRLRAKAGDDVLERLLKEIDRARKERAERLGGNVPALGEPPDDASES